MNCVICNQELTGKQQRFCSTSCKNKQHLAYPNQKQKGYTRKQELIKLMGGKCQNCGYSRHLAALCFHHTRDKLFKLDARTLSNKSWESLLAESKKCILLCANCHQELHYEDLFL